jgi:hypothetical protein
MKELGYAADRSDTSTPAMVGLTAAQAAINFRHEDGSKCTAADWCRGRRRRLGQGPDLHSAV